MPQETFESDIKHVLSTIGRSPLQQFAIPHLVVDNVFPEELVARINDNWPAYEDGFFPEVPGNHVLRMYRQNYSNISGQRLSFWKSFNEVLWPHVISAAADVLKAPAYEVFGKLYNRYLELDRDHPLTLMQADPSYPGHSMHQHFYHAPHWAFTMLLYIDPEDKLSRGTSLHRLLPREGMPHGESSYWADDVDWVANVAIDTFHWEDPQKPDRKYTEKAIDYKSNRLTVFLDGPLALHSVPWDNPQHTANPERARDGGRYARRRILRSHVRVHHAPFYEWHSKRLPEPIEPVSFMRLLAPNAVLSADDQRYRDKVLRPFFRERIEAYRRATTQAPKRPFWERFLGAPKATMEEGFRSQISERIP